MGVVKMNMRWPPWPQHLWPKKFEAIVIVQRLEGTSSLVKRLKKKAHEELGSLVVEIKWKGQKKGSVSLRSLGASVKRSFTSVVALIGGEGEGEGEGVVQWNQEFRNVCTFNGYKDHDMFHPWEVMFTVSNVYNKGPKTMASVIGVASVDLAKHMPAAVDKKTEILIPLNVPGTISTSLSLCVSLRLLKLETLKEYLDAEHRSMEHVPSLPSSPESPSTSRNEPSTLKVGLRRVKIFAEYVSTVKAKKGNSKDEGNDVTSSNRSEDSEHRYRSDTDSLDNDSAIDLHEKNKEGSYVRCSSLGYGTLDSVNFVGGSPCLSSFFSSEDDFGVAHVENYNTLDQIECHGSRNRIISWRKKKLKFKYLKVKKGELLLKRDNGEVGGDDIDYDRRQLSSSDGYPVKWHKIEETIAPRQSFVPEFEGNNFMVGGWECKEFISRDKRTKLHTQVFFASFDQRSKHSGGEGACAVLVAVIADWLKANRVEIPIKCQFDGLIKDGSLEWRILCEKKEHMKKFPDKHLDLDTVLQAKISSIFVLPEKSFVGFFIPEEGTTKSGGFEFLQGAMSFDRIWEEISISASKLNINDDPLVYIVGWNDHFFVLKVEEDAYYIIDTLGERLYEGCKQAYILKFDASSTIEKLMAKENQELNEIICRGKESCKEYIKRFLAAITVRGVQLEVKKGLKPSKPLHHRLQIEFYYTQLKQQ
ncbi:uncharacterized protein LOC130951640 [Arachis stenosperma]|uniref:uncharacterized protein LOC130951640 n=1 Tax=Arachis stenosperma TaxID=217475 RepID=UPI0025AB68EA|nr:uncharacterized protein LOC130951640 [Arachis stenosperma]